MMYVDTSAIFYSVFHYKYQLRDVHLKWNEYRSVIVKETVDRTEKYILC